MFFLVKIPADSHDEIEEVNVISKKGDCIPTHIQSFYNNNVVVDATLLIRYSNDSAGLYAYSISTISFSYIEKPNIRATTLAMACGLHSKRFVNDVYIGRFGYSSIPQSYLVKVDLTKKDIEAAVQTPDLRKKFLVEMTQSQIIGVNNEVTVSPAPDWMCSATQKNHHDKVSVNALAVAMARSDIKNDTDDSESVTSINSQDDDISAGKTPAKYIDPQSANSSNHNGIQVFFTGVTLCLHCRRPAAALCKGCNGAYFCEQPRICKLAGWSHRCLCSTWRIYVQRRMMLSSFPFFSGWQSNLLEDDCHRSEYSYRQFLMTLNVLKVESESNSQLPSTESNWWSTEINGWSGGNGVSAKCIDIFRRKSFIAGFGFEDKTLVPPESYVGKDDVILADIKLDSNHLPILNSWEEYYRLRRLPNHSPAALLLTYPLTVYYAIQKYGIVPVTVSLMLGRPMKIHIVGIEKELNFIDLFRELGFVISENIKVDMTWIVRKDMFPQTDNCTSMEMSFRLSTNLRVSIVGGTYGEDLDPNFDIPGGAPDMVIGLNAGLYAYESWGHVVSYLYHHKSVVGVFTDYNEHSGMNCASLGGKRSRESLAVNPFRQPRAMPVFCMNLPQMCNGFMYVFNQLELEDF